MDHFVGLNFNSNFNFALVGHLLKGKDSIIPFSKHYGFVESLGVHVHINHIYWEIPDEAAVSVV